MGRPGNSPNTRTPRPSVTLMFSCKWQVFFLTGTDEHGQKIAQTAEGMGLKPIDICDKSRPTFFFFSFLWSLKLSDTTAPPPQLLNF